MVEEIEFLHINDTWELAELPKAKKAIACKQVYMKKEESPDDIIRYKARLVAEGYAQREDIDYNEVFSPVLKQSTIRILMTLAAQYDYELDQLDVKTAFLHGDLQEEIYMTQLLGFKATENEKVCKIEKSLYELKQLLDQKWYKRFDKFMMGYGYTRSLFDPCVYFRKLPSGEYIYLLVYVDDMLQLLRIDHRQIS